MGPSRISVKGINSQMVSWHWKDIDAQRIAHNSKPTQRWTLLNLHSEVLHQILEIPRMLTTWNLQQGSDCIAFHLTIDLNTVTHSYSYINVVDVWQLHPPKFVPRITNNFKEVFAVELAQISFSNFWNGISSTLQILESVLHTWAVTHELVQEHHEFWRMLHFTTISSSRKTRYPPKPSKTLSLELKRASYHVKMHVNTKATGS